MTDEEACLAVFDGINSMFKSHQEDGNCAYCLIVKSPVRKLRRVLAASPPGGWSKRLHESSVGYSTYTVFANGHLKAQLEEGLPFDGWKLVIPRTLEAVGATFPDHAKQHLVWRVTPKPEKPQGLYIRLTGVDA